MPLTPICSWMKSVKNLFRYSDVMGNKESLYKSEMMAVAIIRG